MSQLNFAGQEHAVPKAQKKSTPKNFDFEKALGALESLVEKLEKGDLSLEDALKDFEQGIALTRRCQQALAEAEQKVSILLQQDNGAVLKTFDRGD